MSSDRLTQCFKEELGDLMVSSHYSFHINANYSEILAQFIQHDVTCVRYDSGEILKGEGSA